MKPETQVYLDIARQHLADARGIEAIGMFRIVAREAYLVALNAARALIFEALDRTSKSHSGTRTLMHELLPDWPPIERGSLDVLTTGFEHKITADYGPVDGPESITEEQAKVALAAAVQLLQQVQAALSAVRND